MGISHSWNGTVLTITSDSGTSSADLKGEMGIRGPQGAQGEQYRPKFREDYFTAAEEELLREWFLEEVSTVIVDESFTKKGRAADSLAVGRALAQKRELHPVWENPNPGDAFEEQTVNVPFGDTDLVFLEFRVTNSASGRQWLVATVGKTFAFNGIINATTSGANMYVVTRQGTIANGGVTFMGGYQKAFTETSSSANDTRAIPTRIFALREG